MNTKTLLISLSITTALSGCASMGKTDRIGENDGSDNCYIFLNRLDDIAIYYKDDRMKQIAMGSLMGAAVGGGTAALVNGGSTAVIISSIAGAVAGGFLADAYWQNKMQNAGYQASVVAGQIQFDINQDIDNLSKVDQDIANLVRCRTERRDLIKKQFASKIITLQQAQTEWQAWSKLINKDREELKYLNDALDNVRKMEESYQYAALQLDSTTIVTEDMQKQWQNELQVAKDSQLNQLETSYQTKIADKKISKTEKKKLKTEHAKEVSDVKNTFAKKEADIKNKVNPQGNALKPLVASVHEKRESITKSKDQFDNLALEAQSGFVPMSRYSQDQYAATDVYFPQYTGEWLSTNRATIWPVDWL